MFSTELEKQRKYLKGIVTAHPILFSSKFTAEQMKVPPIDIELNEPLKEIKPYCAKLRLLSHFGSKILNE